MKKAAREVLKVQITIGELKSKLTELTTKINSGQGSLESLKRVRENNLAQQENIRKEIRENRLKIRVFRSEYRKIKDQIAQKEMEHEAAGKTNRSSFGKDLAITTSKYA